MPEPPRTTSSATVPAHGAASPSTKPPTGSKTPPILPRLAQRWALAALVGLAVAVTAAVQLPIMATSLRALAAIAIGWLVVIALTPWRLIAMLANERRLIRQFAKVVRQAARDGRRDALKSVVLDQDDELGDLSRAVYDALARVNAQRRESKLLQRTMTDTIRRETDRATQQLQRQATTDPLTGLGNRRSMDRVLKQFFSPGRRRRRDMLVAMIIDVDLFKNVNDTHGHEVGDECLAFLGKLLSSSLRSDDCPVRLGGDEFIILMPNQTIIEACAVAERLAALFRQMPWPHEKSPHPTLSIGLACARSDQANGEVDLFRRADAALYTAKTRGRDRVCSFDEHQRAA